LPTQFGNSHEGVETAVPSNTLTEQRLLPEDLALFNVFFELLADWEEAEG
jgi:hypothetical protein